MTSKDKMPDTAEAIRPAPTSPRIEPIGELSDMPLAQLKKLAVAKGLSAKGGRKTLERRLREATYHPGAFGDFSFIDSDGDSGSERSNVM